jgi:hypothetical protein
LIKKDVYVLLNAVNGFGDFGQHQDGAHIDPHMAYAGLHACIELAATLIRELKVEKLFARVLPRSLSGTHAGARGDSPERT